VLTIKLIFFNLNIGGFTVYSVYCHAAASWVQTVGVQHVSMLQFSDRQIEIYDWDYGCSKVQFCA